MKAFVLTLVFALALTAPAKAEDLIIPRELAQSIADYLSKQPYKDVAPLINQLLQIQVAPPKPVPAGFGQPVPCPEGKTCEGK